MTKRSKRNIKNQQLVKAKATEKFVPLAWVEKTYYAEAYQADCFLKEGTLLVRHFTPYICGAKVKEQGQNVILEWYNYKQFRRPGAVTSNGEFKTNFQIAEECKEKPWVVWAAGKHPFYFATRKEAEKKVKQIVLGE